MASEQECDCLVKLIIIGDSGTGKSCILRQFLDGRFPRSSTNTLGVEFGCKRVELFGHTLKLQIWDTAGQERFRSVTRSYYRGAAAALIVYDVTRLDTFSHVEHWLSDVRAQSSPEVAIAVIGNKVDLSEKRVVSLQTAESFCQSSKTLYAETSALTGQNIEKVFSDLLEIVLKQAKNGALSRKVVLTPMRNQGTQLSIPSACRC